MLRRAIFSSPSGRLLERGSIDHAIRVEHDQIDEGFWLKHAAVGKPPISGPAAASSASPPPRNVLRLGPASISFSTLTISTTSASMLKSDSAVRPTPHCRATSSISPSRTTFEIACENPRKAHKASVPMLTDTDSGFAVMPYGEWHARKPKFSLSVSASRRPGPLRATTEADRCETGG